MLVFFRWFSGDHKTATNETETILLLDVFGSFPIMDFDGTFLNQRLPFGGLWLINHALENVLITTSRNFLRSLLLQVFSY